MQKTARCNSLWRCFRKVDQLGQGLLTSRCASAAPAQNRDTQPQAQDTPQHGRQAWLLLAPLSERLSQRAAALQCSEAGEEVQLAGGLVPRHHVPVRVAVAARPRLGLERAVAVGCAVSARLSFGWFAERRLPVPPGPQRAWKFCVAATPAYVYVGMQPQQPLPGSTSHAHQCDQLPW